MQIDLSHKPVCRFAVLAALFVPLIGASGGESGIAERPEPAVPPLLSPHPAFTGQDIRPGEVLGYEFPGDPVIRLRPVVVRQDALAAIDPSARESHALSLFDDVELRLVFKQFESRPNGFVWTGGIEDDPEGWFAVASRGEKVVGYIWTGDGRTFNVRPVAEDSPHWPQHIVRELEPAKFAPCVLGQEHVVRANQAQATRGAVIAHRRSSSEEGEGASPAGGDACPSDDGSLIDVMIVYTPAARSAAGGFNAINALADLCISSSNNAYNNSQINPRIKLVYVGEVEYAESGSFNTDLSRLRGQNNGYMDEVHTIRNEVGADLVALLNNSSGACGVAYLMTTLSTNFASWAFSVTRHSCAVGNLTFAHELGHNMGCAHDHDNAGNALYAYSYGHRWQGTFGLRRSVMAYAPGTRVPHFSNPDVIHDGAPTGVPPGQPGQAHNALSINNAAWTISQFRMSVCPGPENDTCQTALFLVSGAHEFDTTNATTSGPAEPGMCNFGGDDTIHNDVWFTYVAQCGDGEMTIELCGSDFPTKLGVYPVQCPTQPGTIIACAVSGCDAGGQARITMPVTHNQAFRIRVGGQNGAAGEGVITITCAQNAPDCPADFNDDGEVDVIDLLQLLDAWGPCAGCQEDLNGDGEVDVIDLLQLLDEWGPCP